MTDPIASFDHSAFFKAFESTVLARGLRWKEVSAETGVSPSTLSRMAQGRGPDAASLAILSAWAQLNPAEFTNFPSKQWERRREPLAMLTSSLRTDPRLSSDAAATLEAVIKATYERLAAPETGSEPERAIKKS